MASGYYSSSYEYAEKFSDINPGDIVERHPGGNFMGEEEIIKVFDNGYSYLVTDTINGKPGPHEIHWLGECKDIAIIKRKATE